MSEIVKTCKTHGELTIDQVYEESMNKGLTFRLRCAQCRHDYEIKNKEKRRAYSREYERTKRQRPPSHYEDYVKGKSREWRRANSQKVNARIQKDRKLNPEKYREYDRKWREENLQKARELDVIQKQNITHDDYKWMLEKQNGLCMICKKPETKKSRTSGQVCRLAIDHDHELGLIRDLLCHNCNVLVGHSRESEEIIENTKQYIRRHNERKKLYRELFEKQEGKCACCKLEGKKLVIDFDHNNEEKIRGLLCHKCRGIMIWSEGSIEKIQHGIDFVDEFDPIGNKTEDGFHIWEKREPSLT